MKVGSDFSGVGAFDQALRRLGIDYETVFACDMDKYARQTYIHNYGEPPYYPENVYDREIPLEPLDIYLSSPPCQAFSLAGRRKGEDDKRGVLFYNSHEFIQVNKPRYFIFENVKGLLSDDKGRTFSRWVDMLGGKSVDGNPVLFPREDSVPYHIYHKVLNSKRYGVAQNRERVFIIGIRDDSDNHFRWPKEIPLQLKLKDVLEDDIDEKYYLSEKMVNGLTGKNDEDNGFTFAPNEGDGLGKCVTARCFKMGADDNYIKVNSATKKGYETATEGDSSEEVAQTLDTACNQGVLVGKEVRLVNYGDKRLTETANSNTFTKDIPSAIDSYNQSVSEQYAPTVKLPHNDRFMWDGSKIRRLTPRECFRLMDFPDSFTWPVSDTQAYRQAGNSIVVSVLAAIIDKLKLT